MREYIFTDREREALKAYLEKGKADVCFYVVLKRMKENRSRLNQDMELLEKVLRARKEGA